MVSKTIDVGSIPTAPATAYTINKHRQIVIVGVLYYRLELCFQPYIKGACIMKNSKIKIPLILFMAVLIFADQLTKALAAARLKGKSDYPLIPGILEFSYHENTGAAFSSFLGRQGFLVGLTSLVMLLLIWKYFRIPSGKRYFLMKTSFVLIVCGGIGNLIDRAVNGYVIDYIYFVPINFPKFNLADCYVCIGMVLLVYICFFYHKDEELDFLFKFP